MVMRLLKTKAPCKAGGVIVVDTFDVRVKAKNSRYEVLIPTWRYVILTAFCAVSNNSC
jgi:hypothetical protein